MPYSRLPSQKPGAKHSRLEGEVDLSNIIAETLKAGVRAVPQLRERHQKGLIYDSKYHPMDAVTRPHAAPTLKHMFENQTAESDRGQGERQIDDDFSPISDLRRSKRTKISSQFKILNETYHPIGSAYDFNMSSQESKLPVKQGYKQGLRPLKRKAADQFIIWDDSFVEEDKPSENTEPASKAINHATSVSNYTLKFKSSNSQMSVQPLDLQGKKRDNTCDVQLFARSTASNWVNLNPFDKRLYLLGKDIPEDNITRTHSWLMLIRQFHKEDWFDEIELEDWGGLSQLQQRYRSIQAMLRNSDSDEHALAEEVFNAPGMGDVNTFRKIVQEDYRRMELHGQELNDHTSLEEHSFAHGAGSEFTQEVPPTAPETDRFVADDEVSLQSSEDSLLCYTELQNDEHPTGGNLVDVLSHGTGTLDEKRPSFPTQMCSKKQIRDEEGAKIIHLADLNSRWSSIDKDTTEVNMKTENVEEVTTTESLEKESVGNVNPLEAYQISYYVSDSSSEKLTAVSRTVHMRWKSSKERPSSNDNAPGRGSTFLSQRACKYRAASQSNNPPAGQSYEDLVEGARMLVPVSPRHRPPSSPPKHAASTANPRNSRSFTIYEDPAEYMPAATRCPGPALLPDDTKENLPGDDGGQASAAEAQDASQVTFEPAFVYSSDSFELDNDC